MANRDGLRGEWLHTLKKDDLKILCNNRSIQTQKNTKNVMIEMLLSKKMNYQKKDYQKLTKQYLSLELKGKGIKHSQSAKKTELVEILNKKTNKKKKFTNDTLAEFSLSELQDLCKSRSIETKSMNSKQKLIETLKSTDVPDPRFTPMTGKQLTAEMKGRGLNTYKMKKDDMLQTLKSGSNYECKKLESHINSENVDNLIQNAEDRLRAFIKYMRKNKNEIQEMTEQNISNISLKKNRDYLIHSEWNEFEDFLRNARDEIIDLRTMIEIYADADLGKDEDQPQNKNFDSVINSNEDEDGTAVYVVYNADEELIMDQDKDATLGIFQNEADAEQYKKDLCDDNDVSIHMQEVVLNDHNGAQ